MKKIRIPDHFVCSNDPINEGCPKDARVHSFGMLRHGSQTNHHLSMEKLFSVGAFSIALLLPMQSIAAPQVVAPRANTSLAAPSQRTLPQTNPAARPATVPTNSIPQVAQTTAPGMTNTSQPIRVASRLPAATPQDTSAAPATPAAPAPVVAAPAAKSTNVPTPQQALTFKPLQNVDYTIPEGDAVAACTVEYRSVEGGKGWMVDDANGLPLRQYLDTNGDDALDTWCYFRDGIEVYRDIDSDFNGKADQFRWFHTGGTRWGVDPTEKGAVESWKRISVEETAGEVVAALATKDIQRFRRVLLTQEELTQLKLDEPRAKQIGEQLQASTKQFQDFCAKWVVPANAVWTQFTGGRPGAVRLGTANDAPELLVYENAIALFDAGENSGQIQLGTLVRVGDVWKMIAAPGDVPGPGLFFQPPQQNAVAAGPEASPDALEAIFTEIEKTEAAIQSAAPDKKADLYNQREANYMKLIAATKSPDDLKTWIHQFADLTAASAQVGDDPEAMTRLARLSERQAKANDTQSVAYIQYLTLYSNYISQMGQETGDVDYGKIQEEWFKTLEKFIVEFPESEKAADAMFQLGSSFESMGDEEKAKTWYARAAKDFAGMPIAEKSAGALRRLQSVGNTIPFVGKTFESQQVVDLAKLTGKVVLIYYWTTWSDSAKDEFASLKQLATQYGPKGLVVLAVNVNTEDVPVKAFLAQQKLTTNASWINIREEGGLESAPAVQLGVYNVPTALLVDEKGVVYDRPQTTDDLTRDLRRLFR
ncbi:MAG: redoxin domain-containing protein [Thermoguttaceae bacterium]|nr:redoxin domain-containing protein [Thermoguttaceae bacterium]